MVTVKNCDLSQVGITITGTATSDIIDLSGNYWGEGVDTLEEIASLIKGYDANHVVIRNWYTVNPFTEFILSTSDARNDSVNPSVTSLKLTFTQPIDASTLTAGTIRLLDAAGQEIAITCRVDGIDLIVQWDKLRAEGNYSLFISDELMDITGNSFINTSGEEAAYTLRYDTTMPRLLHHEPQDDVSGKLNNLVLYFSEAMDEELMLQRLAIETTDGSIVHPSAVTKLGGNVYSVTIPEQTVLGSYTIHLGENVVDLAGNAVAGTPSLTLSLQEIELKVASTTVPEEMTCGRLVTVSWTGLNESGSALQGGWTDGVYLSRDGVWDINDIKLGEVQRTSLVAGEVYESSLSFNMPAVAEGEYQILIRPDIKGQKVEDQADAAAAQNLVAIPVAVTMPTISLGGSMQGSLSPDDAVDYVMIGRAGADTASMEFSGLAAGDSLVIYLASGRVATQLDYDACYTVEPGSGQILLPEYALMQDVYLMIERKKGAGEISYQFTASRVDLSISSVQATTRDTDKDCQFIINGCNFGTDARVVLIDSSGREYEAAEVLWVNAGQIKASYTAGSLAEGTYDVKVISGSELARKGGLVTMGGSSSSNLRVGIESSTPAIGNHILSTFEFSYENTGHEAMEAAIITFTMSQNDEQKAFLTLDGSLATKGFWTANRPEGFTSSISILATDGGGLLLPTGRDETLGAGETGDLSHGVTIYYAGWQKPWNYDNAPFLLGYSVMDSSNTTPIDWEAIMDEVGVDGKLRQTLTASLQELVGIIWGDYVVSLNGVASQLQDLGVDTSGMGTDEMLGMLVKHALGGYTPVDALVQSQDCSVATAGSPLEVIRYYASDLVSPGVKGMFGYGWQSNWELELEEDRSGDIHISFGNELRTFQASVRGGYVGAGKDDELYLRKLRDGSFVLNVEDGLTSTFNSRGWLISQVDEYGNTLEYSRDKSGKLLQVSHSSGAWLKFAYNTQGFVSSVTNSYGELTTYSYDSAGNLIEVKDYRGAVTSYSYAIGQEHVLARVEGADGITHCFSRNEQGLLSATYSQGIQTWPGVQPREFGIYNRTTIEYPEAGVVKVTDAYGASSTYYYDEAGKLRTATDAYGNTIRYMYNDEGQLSGIMNQEGRLTVYTYDKNGNVEATLRANGTIVVTRYDEESRLSSLSYGSGCTQSYTYDAHDNVTSISYQDGTSENWTYDAKGNMASWTQQDGTQFTYTYDKVGNVLTATSSEGSVWTYTYNAKDRLTSASVTMATGNSASTTTYTYDARDLLIRMEQDGHSISYTYDDAFRCTSLTDELGNSTVYDYDRMGRLSSVSTGGDTLIRYEYDNIGGRLLKEMKANGTSTVYDYTLTGQVKRITHLAADGQTVQSFYQYRYNKVGLVESMETHEGSWTYEYDAIGQLTHAVFTPLAGSGTQAQDMLYEYDAAGNRTRSLINGVETLYETDAMNRTTQAGGTSYEYDTNGNLILETAADGTTTTHEYNELNQLVRTTTSKGDVYSYSYDAAGNRITMVKNGVATHYSWDAGSNLINEYDAAGDLSIHYDYGNNLIGFEEANEYYHTQGDMLGSVTGLTDDSGNLVQTGSWDSFGNRLTDNESTTDASLTGWLGSWGLMTDEDGKTYMRARYYDATQGKFITSDPIGINGGLNTYAYCLNNGVLFVDKSGLLPWPSIITGSYAIYDNYQTYDSIIFPDSPKDFWSGLASVGTGVVVGAGAAAVGSFFGSGIVAAVVTVGVGMAASEFVGWVVGKVYDGYKSWDQNVYSGLPGRADKFYNALE